MNKWERIRAHYAAKFGICSECQAPLGEASPETDPLVASLNGGRVDGRVPDGEPGIRDVDAPCEDFQPAGAPWVYAAGNGECSSDGHYICAECINVSSSGMRISRGL